MALRSDISRSWADDEDEVAAIAISSSFFGNANRGIDSLTVYIWDEMRWAEGFFFFLNDNNKLTLCSGVCYEFGR